MQTSTPEVQEQAVGHAAEAGWGDPGLGQELGLHAQVPGAGQQLRQVQVQPGLADGQPESAVAQRRAGVQQPQLPDRRKGRVKLEDAG